MSHFKHFLLTLHFRVCVSQHAWIWLLWLLSQTWITLHIWRPKIDRLMSTETLFTMPMYESLFVDQSLALNRRHDEGCEVLTEVT